jgi:tetratricopeptide (TPR) repeat protein
LQKTSQEEREAHEEGETVMTLPGMNMSGAATLAAAEGQRALGAGDTALARQKYAESGANLERDMKAHHGGSEKQLLRFLAATQYYKGGDYAKAQELANRIDVRALPKNVRGLLPQFLKDVKERAAPGYEIGIRRTLLGLWQQNDPAKSLAVLQEHPYVLHPGHLAFLRAVLCEKIADFRAAALFFASAIRRTPKDMELVLVTAAEPLLLPGRGRANEAREYVRYQVELIPHPVTYVSASILAFHSALRSSPNERAEGADEQLRHLEAAQHMYDRLSEAERNHPGLRAYMSFGFEAAATILLRLGNEERSKELWEQAVKFGANTGIPWAKRAPVAFPSELDGKAIEDEYLAEREKHFSTRFAPEQSIREQLEVVGA